MTAPPPPAGWYPDPDFSTVERWWNGTAWTEARRDPDGPDGMPVGSHDRRRSWLFGVGLVVVMLYILGTGSDPSADDDRRTAYVGCQQEVEDMLVAPSTAVWSPSYGSAVTDLGDGRFRVDAVVDSENGFGAMLRTGVSCVVEVDGDRYRLVDVEVG